MSMLDGGERKNMDCPSSVYYNNVVSKKTIDAGITFFSSTIPSNEWIDIKMDLRSTWSFWRGFIVLTVKNEAGKEIEVKKFRMFNHLTKHNKVNR